jgi:hypothetical protein
MKRIIYLIVFLVLLLAGGWWLRQSDHWILWRMGLDPAKLTVRRVQGVDGYMMIYSNETASVHITHSSVTGVSVTRYKTGE